MYVIKITGELRVTLAKFTKVIVIVRVAHCYMFD